MDYRKLKEELTTLKRERSSKNREKQDVESELERLALDLNNMDKRELEEIEQAKREELSRLEREASAPIEEKNRVIESKKLSAKSKYEQRLANINFENYKVNYQTDLNVANELKTSLSCAEEYLNGAISERFREELLNQLQEKTIEITADNIEEIQTDFSRLQRNVKQMSLGKSLRVFECIDKGFEYLNPCKDDEQTEESLREKVILYIGVCVTLTFLIVIFGTPYLVIALIILASFNFYKNRCIYNLIMNWKVLNDNVSNIDTIINEKINKDMEQDRAKLDVAYNKRQTKLDEMLNKNNDLLHDTLMSTRENFMYDDTRIRESYRLTKENLNSKIISLKSRIGEYNSTLEDLTRKIIDKEAEVAKAGNKMIDLYLNYDSNNKGKEFILDNEFLFDMQDNKPVFWEHPKTSCLFLYRTRSSAINFINLIATQLLVRLNVFSINIDIFDVLTVGQDFAMFTNAGQELVGIHTNDTSIEGCYKIIAEELLRRNKIIKAEYSNIDKFNEAMISMESLTESYKFIFMLNPSNKVLDSPEINQFNRVGGSVGIYTNIFMSEDDLLDIYNKDKNFLDTIGQIYLLNDMAVEPRAKDFIKSHLDKILAK